MSDNFVWNTIESDEAVFSEMIEKMGVQGAEFENLLSIDEDTLSTIWPLYGVIFLFKYRQSEYTSIREAGKPLDGKYKKTGTEDLFFAHQKIQNACATHAVLSVVLNRPDLSLGPLLTEYKTFTETFDPNLKGETISSNFTFGSIHNSFSRPPFISGAEEKSSDENDDGLYHFIGYVPFKGELLELDSLLEYPVTHGPCSDEEAPHKLAQVLQRRVQRGPQTEIRFDAIALTKDKRSHLEEAGDQEGLEREEKKRMEWKRQNILRKENFVGLINALVEGISWKENDEEWEKTLESGRAKTQAHLDQMNAQKEKWKS